MYMICTNNRTGSLIPLCSLTKLPVHACRHLRLLGDARRTTHGASSQYVSLWAVGDTACFHLTSFPLAPPPPPAAVLCLPSLSLAHERQHQIQASGSGEQRPCHSSKPVTPFRSGGVPQFYSLHRYSSLFFFAHHTGCKNAVLDRDWSPPGAGCVELYSVRTLMFYVAAQQSSKKPTQPAAASAEAYSRRGSRDGRFGLL